jgi:monoterpene epsilon-lactone hydrolase
LPLREIPPEVISQWYSRRASSAKPSPTLVGMAVVSPATDLTLPSATYDTRADADPFFTRLQVAELVHSYLGSAGRRQTGR